MAFKVAIPQDITDAGKDFLREKGHEIAVGPGKLDSDSLKGQIRDADAILLRTAPMPAATLEAAAKLKVIGRHGIGVDNVDMDYCTKRGIWVTFAPNSNAISVAEHAIGLVVALAHHIPFMDRETRKGNWEVRNKRQGIDLQGRTLGIIGVGRIGSLVAQKAIAAFGMSVLGCDPYVKPDKFPAGVAPASADEIFAKSDFVTLHMPATPETKGMVDGKLLGRMKKTAFLVNCARGEVVNESDLLAALKAGILAGAGLDVFEIEPAKSDNPLFQLDNVIVTPHNAALTRESMDRMGLHAAMGIHSVLNGDKPEWPVNNPLK